MKNLYANVIKYLDTKLAASIGQCIDFDNKKLYLLDSTLCIHELDLASRRVVDEHNLKCIGDIKSFDKKFLLNDDSSEENHPCHSDDIIAMEFVVEIASCLVVFKGGAIIQFGVHSHSPASRCLYKHNTNITSLKLSPDQDLIAIADVGHNVITLSVDAIVLNEANSLLQDKSVHQPVGVGWGSKETQFFGLDGRPSKEKAKKGVVSLSEDELEQLRQIETHTNFAKWRHNQQRGTVIDWRGDGQYLATLTRVGETDKHYLKVWNRNLELQYMSEKLFNIESGILAWIPNGRYVCCCQRRDGNINDILLFEKNGMVHQRITLPTLKNFYFHSISWSPDSAILAIIVHEFKLNKANNEALECKPILLLYTMQNFRYYLKFSTYMVATNFGISDRYFLRWNLTHPNRFHLFSTGGYYLEYDCYLQPTTSPDQSTVVVVDGNKLLITPMTCCKVPPPMSAIELEFNSLIYHVTIHEHNAGSIYVITIDKEIYYTTCFELMDKQIGEYFNINLLNKNASELFRSYKQQYFTKLGDDQDTSNIYQYFSTDPLGQLYMCRYNATTINQPLFLGHPDPENGVELIKEIDVSILTKDKDNHIVAIQPSRDLGEIWLIYNDGSLNCLNHRSHQENPRSLKSNIINQGNLSDEVNFMQIILDDYHGQDESLITLTSDMTLRYEDQVIMSKTCTGFKSTNEYLVFTSSDDQIHFILLEYLISRRFESYSQPIETGGHLIAVDQANCSVVLQMPRGNLEIIQPRILVFAKLTQLLDAENYVQAINLAKRNRINLNFLADYLLCLSAQYDPKGACLQVFANKIADHDTQLLNLFITELEAENTATGRYESILKHMPFRAVEARLSYTRPEPSDKVNFICSHIFLPDEPDFLKPKLLCLLKRQPSQAKAALELVFKLGEQERQEALRFIVYYRDFDQLWNDALATYNLDIALMVANASNKDPKEYLALLDELNSYGNGVLRKHKIDMRVKNYVQAFDRLLEYMFQYSINSETYISCEKQLIDLLLDKKHFKEAIQSLIDLKHPAKTKLITTVWSKYGFRLLEKRHYPEAAVAFTKAFNLDPKEEHLSSAIKCHFLADDYFRAMVLVGRSSVRDDLKNEILAKVLNHLVGDGEFFRALLVSNPPRNLAQPMLDQMIDRGHYQAALYLAEKTSFDDISLRVCMRARTVLNEFIAKLEGSQTEMSEYCTRLRHLISTHANDKQEETVSGDANFISDSLSTVGSLSSTGSNSTKQSSKSGASTIKTRNTLKSNKSQSSNKKRITLKLGSRNEDLAIIKELQKFIVDLKSNKKFVCDLLQILYEFLPLLEAREFSSRCKTVLEKSAAMATTTIECFWPQDDFPTEYSLYSRYRNILSEGNYENINFEILIRPEAPELAPTIFEL